MKTLKHFMLPEHTNRLYKKEAASSIALTRDVAEKINELIDAYNELSKGNLAKEQEQDGRISKAILYMKDKCAFEYNEEIGLQLEKNARMTLINGCGIENNPTADYIDNGRLTKMINSYVHYVATVGGANCTIENSLIDSIVVSGLNNEVKNVRLKYHSYSDDGEAFTDNGIGTIVQNIFNIKAAKNIFPTKKRKSFTVPAGGLEYKNDTNHIVEVYCQAGTIATVQMKRDGENWLALNPSVPAKWILRPDDTINITYSDTPALSYIETYER